MGNENSTLGLSNEDKAELQKYIDKGIRIAKERDEQEQRDKVKAEEARKAQADAERAEREKQFFATQLAEQERLRIEGKKAAEQDVAIRQAAKAKAKAEKAAKVLEEKRGAAGKKTKEKARVTQRAREEVEATILEGNAAQQEDIGKSIAEGKGTRALEAQDAARKKTEEREVLERKVYALRAQRDKRQAAQCPSASQGSEEGEIRRQLSLPRSGTSTPLPLRGVANGAETVSPSSSNHAVTGWGAREQSQDKPSSSGSDRRRSTPGNDVAGQSRAPSRQDSKEPLVQARPSVTDSRPSSSKPMTPAPGDLPPKPPATRKQSVSIDTSAIPGPSHKRSAPSGGFDLSSMPKIPKRSKQAISSSASPRSPRPDDENEPSEDLGLRSDANGQRQPPEWYRKLKANTRRDASHGNVDVLLQRLKDHIVKIKKAPMITVCKSAQNELRTIIHKVFFIQVTAQLLRDRRMLDNRDGLPQIFDSRYDDGVTWPYDLKADAEELYNKWCSRTFEIDLMRGIIVGKPKNAKDKDSGSSDRIDPTYPRIKSNYYGNGRLLNGQWWPTQLTALRDGAHGVSQGGIYGETDKGAYSIIMSGGVDKANNKYPDVDEGDTVLYCGTDNDKPDNKPSDYTRRLIESYKMKPKQPVRLLRSSNADPAYAPELGLRYDGLYEVVGMECMDPPESKRQRHRFKLVRLKDQDPIRGSGPEKRPTEQEVEAYQKDKTLRGYGPKEKQ